MKIYTRKGDDGTTGLLYGGRVPKDGPAPTAYGAVDEAQAAIGLARAETRVDPADSPGELGEILLGLERDLWVLMAELATDPANRAKLAPGQSLVTQEMVDALEVVIDEVSASFEPPSEFVVPGQTRTAAALDLARTVVRRAERDCIAAAHPDSHALPYLNRLSDLLWTLARWQEGTSVATRDVS
jgi:cob(I)alamin adenosyltransferase